MVKCKDGSNMKNLLKALSVGTWGSSIFIIITLALLTGQSYAYDIEKANNYQQLFRNCVDKNIPKALFLITAKELVEKVRSKEDILILDVRTPAEGSIIGINYKNTLFVPMNKVFNKETLEKLPKDKEIIVLCRKGLRSSLITMALRDIGFDNVFSLKGGMISLLEYLSPKTAN